MINNELFNRRPFGLSEQKVVRFGVGYQSRLIITNGLPLGEEDVNQTRELFNMGLYEQLPNLFANPAMTEAISWVMYPDKRESLFKAFMLDVAVMMYMESDTGMCVGYLAVNKNNHILGQYIIPAFRRDRLASSSLECYINRFDVKELFAGTIIGDKLAESYLQGLGFVCKGFEEEHTGKKWHWTYPIQK